MKQNRFRSKLLWAAILAQVTVMLQLTGVLSVTDIELINGLAAATMQILVLVGILNNATDPKNI